LEAKYNKYKPRLDLISWLELRNLSWIECGPAENSGYVDYMGCIYIDVPFDIDNSDYTLLAERLENKDGTPKNRNVRFLYCAYKD